MSRVPPIAVLLLVVAVVAGCGGASKQQSATVSPSGATGAATDLPTSDLAVSSLRASLTATLTARSYLTGIAISTGVANGFDGNGYRAAQRTLRANAIELSDTLGRTYDGSAARQLRALLIARANGLARYAQARQDHDAARARRERAALRDGDATFGRLVSSLRTDVSATQVARAVAPQSAALLRAADAAIDGSPAVYTELRRAAAAAQPLALVIARGLAERQPQVYPGKVDDVPTRLRARLTGALVDQVGLTALTVDAGVNAGFGDRAYHASAALLDANTTGLVTSIGDALGGRATARVRGPLLELTRETLAYARAQRDNEGPASVNALEAMDDSHDGFGTALEAVDDDYDHGQLSGALGAYSDAIASFARADAAGSPKVFDRIDDATRQMPRVAQLVARGVALRLDPKQTG